MWFSYELDALGPPSKMVVVFRCLGLFNALPNFHRWGLCPDLHFFFITTILWPMGAFSKLTVCFLTVAACLGSANSAFAESIWDQGKLLATGGVTQIEGAGGGGVATWALITGYGTERGVAINAHQTFVSLDDFALHSTGVAVGFYDRLELSVTRQWFDTNEAGGRLALGDDFTFGQDIWGAKLRLLGDAIYAQDTWVPQIAVGVQYKNARKESVLSALGARRDEDIDFYASATKALLAQSLIVTATARLTRANQFGLLGFGSENDGRSLEWEGSMAYMLRHNLVLGADYRTKPNNLAFAKEGDAAALYLAYFPNKNISVTVAVVDLGAIALQGRQQGYYLSVQAGF